MEQFPPLVNRAQAVARQAGFPLTREEAGPGRPSACLPGVGRFLAVLAAGCGGGRIGELGTGAGIALRIGGQIVMDDVTPQAALPPDSPLRSDDIKRRLFRGEPRLTWTEVVLPDLRNSLLAGTRAR